jgi:hypothetical protein
MRKSLVLLAATFFLLSSVRQMRADDDGQTPAPPVTPVAGESWLNHLQPLLRRYQHGQDGTSGSACSRARQRAFGVAQWPVASIESADGAAPRF